MFYSDVPQSTAESFKNINTEHVCHSIIIDINRYYNKPLNCGVGIYFFIICDGIYNR